MVKIANLKKEIQLEHASNTWANAHANAPPTPVANFLKYHGSDRVKTNTWNTSTLLSHKHEYNKLRQISPR